MKKIRVEIVNAEGNFSFENAVNESLTRLRELGFTVKDIKYSTTAIGDSFNRVEHSAMIIYEIF